MQKLSGQELNDIKMFCRGYVSCLENQIDLMNGECLDDYHGFNDWVDWNDLIQINIKYDDKKNFFRCFLHEVKDQSFIEDKFLEVECYEQD